ncbi:uncharacterized protein BO97DRAFT_362103 [Aspergillus homomorphus CBS 101889]|uniref:RNase III domain-containing protein n=1 Tax=Aspergillus homomorphus (strain CBS 101889) TaxID=1450537 RepID=A0A395I9J3_ASPHC|nr:hypothetical protein BO97DRAFT_362103 [Aspergillus homomorphus CBS 101889]RAL15893.1 hypothetical protein BO97DRAFT_362103 [Aspergillus homomorphus CBS 101889]
MQAILSLLPLADLLCMKNEAQRILGYRFQVADSLLTEALTAPGAEGEGFQGNRWLADFGIDTIRSCVTFDSFQRKEMKPKDTASLKQQICSYSYLRAVAERTAFDRCIIYNPRSGRGKDVVVGKALAAAIGAAHLDNGKDYERTLKIIHHLGLMNDDKNGIDPKLVQLEIPSELDAIGMPDAMAEIGMEIDDSWPRSISGHDYELSASVIMGAGDDQSLPDTPAIQAQETPSAEVSHLSSSRGKENVPQDFSTDMPTIRTSQREDSRLTTYLQCEERRCAAHRLPLPTETYYTKDIQADIESRAGPRNLAICQRLLLCVGGAESLIQLQEAIKSWRAGTTTSLVRPLQTLTESELFRLIEINAQNICYQLIQRRYYIWALFLKSGGADVPSSTGFVAYNTEGVSRKPGNPVHSMDTAVSKRILQEVAPSLDEMSPEYRRKLDSIKVLRALGRKYYTLTSNFGPGILALIPSTDQLGGNNVTISGSDISRMPNFLFNRMLSIMKRTQESALKDLSQVIWDTLEGMLNHSGTPGKRLWLEDLESSDILRFPKNSSILRRLFDGSSDIRAGL